MKAGKARDLRFRKFVDKRFEESTYILSKGEPVPDGPPDFDYLFAEHGPHWEGWQSLNKEFEVTERVRKTAIAAKRREAGRKGGKIGGRGRPKKSKKPV